MTPEQMDLISFGHQNEFHDIPQDVYGAHQDKEQSHPGIKAHRYPDIKAHKQYEYYNYENEPLYSFHDLQYFSALINLALVPPFSLFFIFSDNCN